MRRGPRTGLFCIVAVHSTVRGPSLGGCRMWTYDDNRAAIRDALRLSEGMTYKSAVAGLPLGGGKGVIVLEPGKPLDAKRRRAALVDFGETVERLGGSYVTAEDVGTSTRDMTVIAKATGHVSGLSTACGRLRRPEPLHGPRRPARDRGDRRAHLRLSVAAGTHDRCRRPRSRRSARRQAAGQGRRAAHRRRHRPDQARRGRAPRCAVDHAGQGDDGRRRRPRAVRARRRL